MSDSSLGSNPEYQKLLEERDFLSGKLGDLSAERETCLHVEGPNLQSLYYQKVGNFEVACLQRELECARIKREIELITAAVNSGSAWDYEKIGTQLDQEFQEWKERLAGQVQAVEDAQKRLSNLMKPEDSEKLHKLYRALAKELHPDVQPSRHPRLRPLWDWLQRAYRGSDLEEMELIGILIKDEQAIEPPNSLEELRKEVEHLQAKCKSIIDALFKIRENFPFTMADLLSDPVGLEEKQQALVEKLGTWAERRTALLSHLNALLDSRS